MKINRKYIFFFFLLQVFFVKAQLSPVQFQKDFLKANVRAKVKMVAALSPLELKEIYSSVKDTLEKIKKNIYAHPDNNSNVLKFLLDKIYAKKELYAQNYGKAIFILENALRHTACNIDDTLTCLSMLKNVFVQINNVSRAFEMQYIIENKWHRKSDSAYIDFGQKKSSLFYMLGLHHEAIKHRRTEYNSLVDKSDTNKIINFYNDMGVFYNKLKNSDSAEFYFFKAKNILTHKKYKKGDEDYYNFYKGLIDGNIAQSYYNKGLVKESIPLLKQDAYYSLKAEKFESAFNSYKLIAQCYIDLKDKDHSRLYLDSCEALLDTKLSHTNLKIKFLPLLAKYYTFTGDYKKATLTYSDYFRINDSLLMVEKERDVINQGLTFNIEQRELAYAEQKNLLKQKETDANRQSSYRKSLLAGVFFLLIIIAFLVVNNRRAKRREIQLSLKNDHIQDQNKQIEQSLKEKEALIKEIHHRVKNNLQIITSMLNLQIGKINDEKTESIFFEAKQRINAIALTHQMLYQKTTISTINLVEYIETLVRQIEASMSTSKIEIVTHLVETKERLNIDGAVPLGLIINELLTNCYKHAFPQGKKGVITVSLIENPDSFTIKVSDNGIGLPEDFNHEESKTLGMELVFILVEQLESKLRIEKTDGSTFLFDIKKHS